jgi:ribosomal subunit interface protein
LAVRVYLENIERKKTDPAAAKAKVKLEIPGKDIVVKEAAHDLYAAMTEAFKSAQRQLRKLKDKRLQRQR